MNSMTKNQVWYGELRSARGNTIVIYDQDLPDASSGRIYLYNTNRQAIIEYVKEIVENNLHDLDTHSLKKAQDNYTEAWKGAKNEFLDQHKQHADLEDDVPNTIVTSKDEYDLETSDSEGAPELKVDSENDSWPDSFKDEDEDDD